MEHLKILRGPFHEGHREAVLVPAGAGPAESLEGFADIRTRIASYADDEAAFSVVDMDLPAGGTIPRHANTANDRILICYAGRGTVRWADRETEIAQGAVVFCQRGGFVEVSQTGTDPLRLTMISLIADSAGRDELFPLNRQSLSLSEQAAQPAPDATILVEAEDEGEQYWQAAPSLGYITLKFDDLPVDYFSASSQTLDPDAAVRLHGHQRSTEIVVCTRGRGLCVVGDVERDFAEGDLLILPPGITHRFINDSGKPWTYTGLFTPPSVESALRETGMRKLPGAERPVDIPRNPTTERLLVDKYGFIIPSLQ
ncbi:cupin domain-containing protein [Sphingopyxis terrae]|uniref:cupin domain-containing protein n=1 Tax=Sphingopyxis terrae TaxID=33052 RepID=UPI002A0ADFC7|nr:cupin domain-containing protein [Sphingopyxis terrae]MDX8356481.1 cupin domain-containing protein [Sphingopyxis terrae]